MQNIVIVQRTSLLYLAKAMLGTRRHTLHVKPLIHRSPQRNLDFEGAPKSIWIPVPKREHGRAFLQE